MVLLQQVDPKKTETFGDVSKSLLQRIAISSVVYFVTDQYKEGSVKSFERQRRQNCGTIKMEISKQRSCPKQWKKFLADSTNKTELFQFLLKDWSDHPDLIDDRTVFFNLESKFFKLTSVEEVNSNQRRFASRLSTVTSPFTQYISSQSSITPTFTSKQVLVIIYVRLTSQQFPAILEKVIVK